MFIIPAPNPIAFNLFNIPIYKYGICMAFAILFSMLVSNWLWNKYSDKKDLIFEYAPLIIIMGIIGARLYFCLLNYNFYIHNFIEIFNLRQGGLSIHGAILGGICSIAIIAKLKNQSFIKLIDTLTGGVFLGQAIGRFGNYFNSEAFGIPVKSQNWGLFIPKDFRPEEFCDFQYFHPTFLYESCLDFIGFFIIIYLYLNFRKKYNGLVFFSYLILYAIIRFFIEQIRLDSALNIASVPIAQIVSVIMFILGIVGLYFVLKKNIKTY